MPRVWINAMEALEDKLNQESADWVKAIWRPY
jgi:hypothetical protein